MLQSFCKFRGQFVIWLSKVHHISASFGDYVTDRVRLDDIADGCTV